MRLEHDNAAAIRPALRGRLKSRGEFSRVMGVVIHQFRLAPARQRERAQTLKAPPDTTEPGQRLAQNLDRQFERPADAERRQRVVHLMLPRQRQIELAERLTRQLHLKIIAVRFGAPVDGAKIGRLGEAEGQGRAAQFFEQPRRPRIVQTDHRKAVERQFAQEAAIGI